jgi:hypothetical protein
MKKLSECSVGQKVKLLEPREKDEERVQCATDFISGMFHYYLYSEEDSIFLNRTGIPVPNSITSQKTAFSVFVEFNDADSTSVCTAPDDETYVKGSSRGLI